MKLKNNMNYVIYTCIWLFASLLPEILCTPLFANRKNRQSNNEKLNINQDMVNHSTVKIIY